MTTSPSRPAPQVATDQPGFDYFECRECGFSSVQRTDFDGGEWCPLCAEDCGRDVRMGRRTCRSDDRPEGFDARKGTRAEQATARSAPALAHGAAPDGGEG